MSDSESEAEPETPAPAAPAKGKGKTAQQEQRRKQKEETGKPTGKKTKTGKKSAAESGTTELAAGPIVPLTPGTELAAAILQTLSDKPIKPKKLKMGAPKPIRRSSRLKG
ncbi:hypothetical protein P3X46_001228 [Hevea brasiliensis]|uniref:Uncharacterized protein n=1 Tax=Hevea brasiliensis TaxID=3981 RepID=A0ABQ9NCJ7_HEVBR|nr:hypothetical protein P3X46_001228 [Hevea brasiliensis]